MTALVLILHIALLGVDPPPEPEPEERRLPARQLRTRLRELGLVDLLELHLQQAPPDSPLEAHLQGRQLALLQYGRQDLPAAERLEAARRASDHLRALITEFPDHEDRFMWRLDLGRDLIDRQAEPYYNNIMFRGGTAQDRDDLAELTSEAIDVYASLIEELSDIESEIDDMSIAEFERMQRTGRLQQVEQLLPRARYLSMWANYYHCLTLTSRDPTRIDLLNRIITYLTQDSQLVDTPHDHSHYQAQSLLLAGMAYRLLSSSDRAEVLLDRAAGVASTLPDIAERQRLRWVVTLAELERVRNFRDARDYDRALRTLARYRSRLDKDDPERFNIEYALALLEGTVCRAQAEDLPPNQARRKEALLLRARQPLLELAEEHPRYRNAIYSQIFEEIDGEETPASDADLDSFEKNIIAARLLQQASDLRTDLQRLDASDPRAQRLRQEQNQLLSRAVKLAFGVLEDDAPLARKLHAEARFNVAVCFHVQGQVLAAIEQFNRVVADHPDFERRKAAALYAAKLGEGLYADTAPTVRNSIREPVLQALHTLIREYPSSSEAGARHYVYARILQDARRFADAAAQYDRVPITDARATLAQFHRAQCELQLARAEEHGDLNKRSVFARRAREAAEAFSTRVGPDGDNARWADARLIVAEAILLDPRRGTAEAVEVLDAAESALIQYPQLAGRAMRLRILAYQDLGQSEQAASIIPGYIKSDPARAGATLQGLLEVLNDEIAQARASRRPEIARRKARDAVIVARELSNWAMSSASGLDTAARTALRLEYGEALMRTERPEDRAVAYTLFDEVVADDAARRPDGQARNARAIQGLAEAAIATERFAEALPHFSRLHRLSPENSEVWWSALLGEVRCRAELDQDPQMLYKLIEQKKAFFPKMGGSDMRRRFQRLQQELKSKTLR